jgi:hypothetical protein
MSDAAEEEIPSFLGARISELGVEPRPHRANTVLCIPSLEGEMEVGSTVEAAVKVVDRVLVCDTGPTGQEAAIARKAGAFVVGHVSGREKEEIMAQLLNEALYYDPSFVVMMDLNRSNDPTFIPKLISPLQRGEADITVGVHEEKGVLALHANLFALNARALSTSAGADFFKSMAGGDDREIADAGLKLMAVFFDATKLPKRPKAGPKQAVQATRMPGGFSELFNTDRPDALAMIAGIIIGGGGVGLMGWILWWFFKQNYTNTTLLVVSSTLVLVGVMIIVSASMHSYLRRIVR